MRHIRLSVIAVCLYCVSVQAVLSCNEPIVQPLTFVSLWDTEANSKLENFRKIEALCGKERYSAVCLEKNLSSMLKALPIHSSPDSGQPFGTFLMLFTGEDVKVTYTAFGRNISPVELDLYDSDFGYGPEGNQPYFHQTMLDSKNGWYKITVPDNNNKTGWVQLSNPHILTYKKGDIVSFKSRNYVILEIKKDAISLREEQPQDKWCKEGDPPALRKFKPLNVPIQDLYDKECRLLLKVVYTRGC